MGLIIRFSHYRGCDTTITTRPAPLGTGSVSVCLIYYYHHPGSGGCDRRNASHSASSSVWVAADRNSFSTRPEKALMSLYLYSNRRRPARHSHRFGPQPLSSSMVWFVLVWRASGWAIRGGEDRITDDPQAAQELRCVINLFAVWLNIRGIGLQLNAIKAFCMGMRMPINGRK